MILMGLDGKGCAFAVAAKIKTNADKESLRRFFMAPSYERKRSTNRQKLNFCAVDGCAHG
jgi:hypothetical protein